MKITRDYLTPNEYSRPQKRLASVRAVVMHWTANPAADAKMNRDFFENRKTGTGGTGSAHYIIGQDGKIISCIPENEVAYHCGSDTYTEYAKDKFGAYYTSRRSSPNFCTIGVELCPTDREGNFTKATIEAAMELCADICARHGLTADDITTHNAIVGWKDCPRLWVNKPELFDAFKASVNDYICRGSQ